VAVEVLDPRWGRPGLVQLAALHELNRYWPEAHRAGFEPFPLDAAVERRLPHDLRVVATWDDGLMELTLEAVALDDAPLAPVRSLPVDPGAASRRTAALAIREASGPYRLSAQLQGRHRVGLVTVHVDIFTDWGRPGQRRRSLTLQPGYLQDSVDLGVVDLGP